MNIRAISEMRVAYDLILDTGTEEVSMVEMYRQLQAVAKRQDQLVARIDDIRKMLLDRINLVQMQLDDPDAPGWWDRNQAERRRANATDD